MKKFFFPLLAAALLFGCLGLEDVDKLFAKRVTGLAADKAEYRSGETITLTATAADRKYAYFSAAPFRMFRFSPQLRAWEELDVGMGPATKIRCKEGKIEMSAVIEEDNRACRQLETLNYEWYGASWHYVKVLCGDREIEETRIVNETGRIRAQLPIFNDKACSELNSTLLTEFTISP
ncbi:MAG TPA: hypothetical protein VJI13_03080 [Candidatus Norongarragalinales archaeon]|nr:hypothetical protein [Candidatus Norongarragalinales archaeon]